MDTNSAIPEEPSPLSVDPPQLPPGTGSTASAPPLINTSMPPPSATVNKPVPEILLPPDGESEWEEDDGGGEGGRGKTKLVRSHAIRDSSSPPLPQRQSSPQSPGSVGMRGGCGGEGDQRSIISGSEEGVLAELMDSASVSDSGRGDTDTPDESTYTDSTGIDLTQFIISTLNKNTKDRMIMLKLEAEMSSLVKDPKKNHHKFPQMSSYHRMLVHRVAAYFGLDHNVDQSGNCVIVNKTKTTRLPDMKFKDHIPEDVILTATEPKRLIMKRESCSCESWDRHSDSSSRRSKSIEEREEEYERVKRRIFSEGGRDHHHHHSKYPINLGSIKGSIPSRSFDIRETLRDSLDRPQVSKSFSFGGYPAAQPLEPHRHKSNPPKLSRGQVVWAVSDMGYVPKGSILINPDTGTPYLNSDGSVYIMDPTNPPRFMEEDNTASSSPHPSSPSPLLLHQELSKLSLEGDKSGLVAYGGGWMVPQTPARAAPYILVNPVSPHMTAPQYLPCIAAYETGPPGEQSKPGMAGGVQGSGMAGGMQGSVMTGVQSMQPPVPQPLPPTIQQQTAAALQSAQQQQHMVAAATLQSAAPLQSQAPPPQVYPPPQAVLHQHNNHVIQHGSAVGQAVSTVSAGTPQGASGGMMQPGQTVSTVSHHTAPPLNNGISVVNNPTTSSGGGTAAATTEVQFNGGRLLGAPIQKPFLFSLHRSPTHSVVIYLQHCPAILTRSQLMSMLDHFMNVGGGHIQFMNQSSQWVDINTLPPDHPTTNRYPIQLVFDTEDQAAYTIAKLKNAGFIMEPQDH